MLKILQNSQENTCARVPFLKNTSDDSFWTLKTKDIINACDVSHTKVWNLYLFVFKEI